MALLGHHSAASFADQGPFSMATFFQITYKKNMLSGNLPLYSYYEEHENYLQGKLHLTKADSGEIFKIIILPRRLGATYCTV